MLFGFDKTPLKIEKENEIPNWNLQKFNDPWPYVVIDNFFTTRVWDYIFNSFNVRKTKFENFDTLQNNKVVYFENFHDKTIHNYFSYFINEDFLLKHFSTFRSYSELYSENEVKFIKNSPEYKLHIDHERKVLSCVVYIAPKNNVGTILYDKNKNYVKTIEWKPNRCFLFAPIDEVTWHSFKGNSNTTRFTINYMLTRQSNSTYNLRNGKDSVII